MLDGGAAAMWYTYRRGSGVFLRTGRAMVGVGKLQVLLKLTFKVYSIVLQYCIAPVSVGVGVGVVGPVLIVALLTLAALTIGAGASPARAGNRTYPRTLAHPHRLDTACHAPRSLRGRTNPNPNPNNNQNPNPNSNPNSTLTLTLTLIRPLRGRY